MAAQPIIAKPARSLRPTLGSAKPALPPLAVGVRLASRHVAFLKVALPLIALVLLGLVLAWPRLNPDTREFRLGAGKIAATVETEASRMIRPRYVGTDDANQPFTVVADTATHAGSADRILLDQPKADVTLRDGSWVAVNAREGLYDRVRQTLGLRNDVTVFHDAGYEFHTEAADVDLHTGSASGTAAVEGQGPFGHLTAEGFQILNKGSTILFLGKSRIELRPEATQKAAPKR